MAFRIKSRWQFIVTIVALCLYCSFSLGDEAAGLCSGLSPDGTSARKLADDLRMNFALRLINGALDYSDANKSEDGEKLSAELQSCMQKLKLSASNPSLCLQRATQMARALAGRMAQDAESKYTAIPDWVRQDAN